MTNYCCVSNTIIVLILSSKKYFNRSIFEVETTLKYEGYIKNEKDRMAKNKKLEGLKIPKGIQSGQIVRIKGKGMPDPRRRINGDQFVKINIITSDNKSNDFILLLEKMNKILGNKPEFTKIK